MLLICENCVTHPWLSRELSGRGSKVDHCNSCGGKDKLSLPVNDERIRDIFRILLIRNFSEREYSPILGGRDLTALLRDNHQPFGISHEFDKANFYPLATAIDDVTSINPTEHIPIRGSYDRPLLSLRQQGDTEVQALAEACGIQNYFRLSERAKKIIDLLKNLVTTPIESNRKYFRARIGFETEKSGPIMAFGRVTPTLYTGYSGTKITALQPSLAKEGRLNRARVSVLYAASDPHTALGEVRPHPGHFVSIAEFACQRELRSANFAYPNVDPFLCSGGLTVLRTVIALGDFLSAPVPPDQKNLYLITQLIGDAVREAGFDAIEFKSSVGEGTNIVFFDSMDCQFVPNSEWVERIDYVTYGSTKMHAISAENEKKYHMD